MGIFDFLFNKKHAESKSRAPAPEPPALSARNYANLIELTRLLTNGDADAIAEMTELARDFDGYRAHYREWVSEMVDEKVARDDATLLIFAYRLAGYDSELKFGAYIDWKEGSDTIVWLLNIAVQRMGYPLDLESISFDGEEDTFTVLGRIDETLRKSGFTLVSLDTGGDCYHLYIAKRSDYERIRALGEAIGFRFSNDYDS